MSAPVAPDSRWYVREVQPHAPGLLAWLRRAFPAVPDPEDLVQEALLRVWQSAQAGPVAQPRALLFATARHLAIDRCRREKVIPFEPLPETGASLVFPDEPSPADATARRQELLLLHEAIAQLPDRCREVLTLRKLHGLSQREIAARLGISEHTVETHIGTGLRRCAAFLARHGLPG